MVKIKRKIFKILLAALVFVFAFAIGTTFIKPKPSVSAENTAPILRIEKQNLSFRDNIAIKYAVKAENTTVKPKLLIWTNAETAEFYTEEDYVLGTQNKTLTTVGVQDINGERYDIFDLTNVTAMQMTDVFYARAYVEQNENIYYSRVKSYCVAQYAHDIQGLNDENLHILVDNMLIYGASAQQYFDYHTNWLATDEAYTLSIVNGILPNGLTEGFYKAGTTLHCTPAPDENGQSFSHWENSAGETISAITVTKDDTYTAVYATGPSEHTHEEREWIIDKAATCAETGSKHKECTTCGEIITIEEILATGHSYSSEWTYDETYHWHTSTCAHTEEISEKAKHSFDEDNLCTLCKYACPTSASYFTFTLLPDDTYAVKAKDVNNLPSKIRIPSIYNGKSVTNIENEAFYYCVNLTDVVIPDSVTSIGLRAFLDCENLTSVITGDGVTSIGDAAFCNCYSLTSVKIGNSVTDIGSSAFSCCNSLQSVIIGESVANIGEDAFSNCPIFIVYYTGDSEKWEGINIDYSNSCLVDAIKYYYSETEPDFNDEGTAYGGNFWHYDSDCVTPVIWKKEN